MNIQGKALIRRPCAQDEALWRGLWKGYLDFYRAEVSQETTASLWRDLLESTGSVRGYVADAGAGAVGLVHYVFHRSTWSQQRICYLQDLYVAGEGRGSGAARALMEACFEDARLEGAFRVYWQTQEYNAAARSLYDTIVPRSSFIVYRKPL